MEKIFRLVANFSFAIPLLAASSADAESKISFPDIPQFTAEDYATYLLWHIPLDQYKLEQAGTVKVSGDLTLDLSSIRQSRQARVREMLESVISGGQPVMDLELDFSEAFVTFLDDARARQPRDNDRMSPKFRDVTGQAAVPVQIVRAPPSRLELRSPACGNELLGRRFGPNEIPK